MNGITQALSYHLQWEISVVIIFFIKDIRVSFILIRNAIIKMFFYSFFFGHLYASFASCYISPLSCFFVFELI